MTSEMEQKGMIVTASYDQHNASVKAEIWIVFRKEKGFLFQ